MNVQALNHGHDCLTLPQKQVMGLICQKAAKEAIE